MKKLGERNFMLLSMSMQTCGFNEPADAMMYEEQMYVNEGREIWAFVEWLFKNKRPFGRANYEQRFSEFKKETNV